MSPRFNSLLVITYWWVFWWVGPDHRLKTHAGIESLADTPSATNDRKQLNLNKINLFKWLPIKLKTTIKRRDDIGPTCEALLFLAHMPPYFASSPPLLSRQA